MERSPEESVKHGQGKIARIQNRVPHFASVELTIRWPAQESSIDFDGHGEGWIRQGTIEEVPAKGYDHWKQGALAGIRYALTRCQTPPCHVTITRIVGMITDTNPTIVGGAAIQAVWMATDYEPSFEEKAFVEHLVFQSWKHASDAIPNFGS